MDNPNVMNEGKVCKCPHHKVVPLMILLIGIDLFFGSVGWLSAAFVNVSWPILLIIAGATKLAKGACKCCAK